MKSPASLPFAVLALCGVIAAQQNAPRAIFHAKFLSSSGTRQDGGIVFQTAAGDTLRCSWDRNTWFEREHERISAAALQRGERIEIVTDRAHGADTCYVRLVSVIAPPPARPRRPSVDLSGILSDQFLRQGDRSISGVVAAIAADSVTLRTRSAHEVRVGIRPETRYLANGHAAAPADLTPNTRVFIRGGTDLDGNLEAWQVVWGDILDPLNQR